MGAPPLAFLLLLAWKRKQAQEEADAVGMRRKRADKVARQHLRAAKEALDRNERDAFYAALSKALNGYLTDKFGLGQAEMDVDTLRKRLADSTGGTELADRYAQLITACDMARFSPLENEGREAYYNKAVDLIGRVEDL
jgi:hypothetical protein